MAPSKAERAEKEQLLSGLGTKLFCDLLDDFIMDISLEAYAEVCRSRAICETCGTRCNSAHVPQASSSRSGTPAPSEAGTSTPTKGNGAVTLECVNCQRMIASNRYASHLSDCMGLNSSRRGPGRGTTKTKATDAARSGSPASEVGFASDDGKSTQKGKGKKAKRAEEADSNLKRKRPLSPSVSPVKKQKQKGSPVARIKSERGGIPSMSSLPPTNSQSKIPSKLRDSSTAPANDSDSDNLSRESSPDASLSSALNSFKNKGLAGRPAKIKQPSPPRPPPPVPAYIEQDDEGDETGSSTDTSESS